MKLPIIFLYGIWFILPFIPGISTAQLGPDDENRYREEVDDPYIPIHRSEYRTSPPYFYQNGMITTYQVNVNEDGNNMLGDAANEPSIAIDPTNPLRMAIGWRQFDTQASNFRQAGYAFSLNGGKNWTFTDIIEPGVFRSDPVLGFNDRGILYFNSLNVNEDHYSCDLFKSDDETSWDNGRAAHGGDKLWMAIDRTESEGNGNVYAHWLEPYTECNGSFTRSFDEGETFEDCSSLPRYPMAYGTNAIGPLGELYVTGFVGSRIYFSRAIIPYNKELSPNWSETKVVSLGGTLVIFGGPNPDGLLGQPWLAVDHSAGPGHGNVYLLSTLKRDLDEADVLFARSEDRGETWSDPLKINNDSQNNWNWFGTMSIAPNGRIDVAWLDTRDHKDSHNSSLYFSYSTDGGYTWSPNVRLSESFDPHVGYPNQSKIGDYCHMISDNEAANLAWAATFNGEQDVYYSRIQVEKPMQTHDASSNNSTITLYQNQPNPFNNSTQITYNIKRPAYLKLEIFDMIGNKIKTLCNSYQLPGHYSVEWNGKDEKGIDLPGGIYFYRLYSDNNTLLSKRMLLMR